MEIEDIRLANLEVLIRDAGRPADFCRRVNMSPSYMSQIRTGRKVLGSSLARKIEDTLGIERGWLDSSHDETNRKVAEQSNDILAAAYAMNALPAPLREELRRLIHVTALYCRGNPDERRLDD